MATRAKKPPKPKVYRQKLSNGCTRTTNSKTGKQRVYKPKKK